MRDSGGTYASRWSARGGRRQRFVIAALLGVAGLVVAACSGTSGSGAVKHGQQAGTSAARVTITPSDGTTTANPSQGVSVGVSHGKLRSVSVSTGADPITGYLNPARTVWHSMWALQPSHDYTVQATAVDPSGRVVTRTSTFRTLTPSSTISAQIFESQGQTYGVGMPIMIKFSGPVTHEAAVERSMQLWTSKPIVGAWYWDGNTSLVFRPRTYWPQHTQVRFLAHLDGIEVAKGVYAVANLSQTFRIGNSLIAVVSTTSHYAHIYYKDKLFGVWPVSTGSPGDDTQNGTYLTIEKGNPVLMSGPGYTNFPVPYAVRFTWSGNYMHDAYWSVAEQGYTNVSHGCVNMSPYHAQIYYNLAVPGDPVTVVGSPAPGNWDDGWTEWFLTWNQFLRGSATHMAVQAGPNGSTFVNPATLPAVTATSPLQTSRPGNALASS